MAGGAVLADLRGRAIDWRFLTRIDAMELAAQAQYRVPEQALLGRISGAETSLRELAPESEDASVLGSAEMVAKSEELRADLLATRAELRQLRYDLRRDVEALQAGVTTLNAGFVPFFAAVLALSWRCAVRNEPFPTKRPDLKPRRFMMKQKSFLILAGGAGLSILAASATLLTGGNVPAFAETGERLF